MPSKRFFNLSEEKRELIRKASTEEFCRVPLESVSINRIVKNAGISRGSFYTYFDDKRDLMNYLLNDIKEKEAELMRTGIKKTYLLTWLIKQMYKIALAKNKCIFFQNDDNLDFFIKNKLLKTQYRRIPGSGVNLQHFRYEEYPETDGRLVYVGRIMRDKGIGELLSIIPELVRKYPRFVLEIVGGLVDESYTEEIKMLETQGKVYYRGAQLDVRPFLKRANAIVLPSYHEGMANVLLEAAATGRPILASSIPGCRETFDEGVSGQGFSAQDPDDLLRAVERFLALPHERKCQMGKAAREKVEREFDRQIVVDAYVAEILR